MARFLTLTDVTEVLNISTTQAYSLLRSGELPGIQVGPRKIWRIEATELEAYIQRMYAQTRARREAGLLPDVDDAEGSAREPGAQSVGTGSGADAAH